MFADVFGHVNDQLIYFTEFVEKLSPTTALYLHVTTTYLHLNIMSKI